VASGCGGDDSDTTAAGGSDQPAATSELNSAASGSENGGEGGNSQAGGEEAGEAAGGDGPDSADDGKGGLAGKAKSDVEGFKAPPGGDDSIQTFGDEAESSEEEEIVAAMGSFLRAMASDDYPAICAGISAANREQLEQLVKLKKEGPTDCPSLLKTLLVGPNTEAQKAAEGTVYEVRVEGENAFILFTPRDGTASYFVMKRDPDGWKSTSIGAGTPFDPVAAGQ
jgi:hypothetical protein